MFQETVTVKVNDSAIVGRWKPATESNPKALNVFYGIHYATSERYKEPTIEALDAVSGEFDATRSDPSHGISENCLIVHVTRPSTVSEGSKIPVVMYYHGGGFNFGSPLDSNLEAFVARAEKDIMTVSVAYRLGALGFGPGDNNLGLKDQRAAVEWVSRWIGKFGGDGEDVTLMGVSAGAHSVGLSNPFEATHGRMVSDGNRSVIIYSTPKHCLFVKPSSSRAPRRRDPSLTRRIHVPHAS